MHTSSGSVWDLIPSRHIIKSTGTKHSERSSEDVEYEKLTWAFIGLALGSIVSYFALMGPPVRIIVRKSEEDEDEDEERDEGGEVGEEDENEEGDVEEETLELEEVMEDD